MAISHYRFNQFPVGKKKNSPCVVILRNIDVSYDSESLKWPSKFIWSGKKKKTSIGYLLKAQTQFSKTNKG